MQLTPLGGRGLSGLEVVDSLLISIKLCGHGSAQLKPRSLGVFKHYQLMGSKMLQISILLKNWIESLGENWNLSPQEVALIVAADEIRNRMTQYSVVREALHKSPFDIKGFAEIIRSCWVMGGRFDSVRFNAFIRNEDAAYDILQALIVDFPKMDDQTIRRIDDFLHSAVKIGFSTPNGGSDFAGAAQFASLILTSILPNRFVDYRRSRWQKFAEALDYLVPPKKASHGEWIVWAGQFAKKISETPMYREFWPISEKNLSVPAWVISGLCWVGLKPPKPISDPVDPDSMSFPEGAEKRRLHLFRERNRSVVAKAKALALETDPFLRCQVCNFSFTEKYGNLGSGFIEAHHRVPVAELKKGSKTRVEDIALVCSNCHRMIHHGDKTLSIDKIRQFIANKK